MLDNFAQLNRRTVQHGVVSQRIWSEMAKYSKPLRHWVFAGYVEASPGWRYGRGELIAKRRALMDAWADFCMGKGDDDP